LTIRKQIFEEICNFSLDIELYHGWLKDKKTTPLVEIKEIKQEPELVILPQIQETVKPGAKKDDPQSKKDSKADTKSTVPKGGKKPTEEAKKEEILEEIKPIVVPKIEEKSDADLLNTYENQLKIVPEENLTVGALLEAIVDEVSQQTKNPSDKLM